MDGVALQWTVPPNIAADLEGFAYYADGSIAPDGYSGTIYSPPSP